MKADLAEFLARHKALVEDVAVWGDLPIRTTSYLTDELPPLDYITPVRTLVLRDDSILVVRNPDEVHIIPGGQCEVGETFEETLRREVLEETGWTITGVSMLGFMHFHHLKSKPPDYKYLHPDFIQLIYMAQADRFIPGAKRVDDYEIESHFYPLDDVEALKLSQSEKLTLNAANTQYVICNT